VTLPVKKKDNVTTFEVRVSISNPGGELKANMSATPKFFSKKRRTSSWLPKRHDL